MAAFPQPAKNCGMLQQLSTKPPKQTWLWQDIVPAGKTLSADDVASLKTAIAELKALDYLRRRVH